MNAGTVWPRPLWQAHAEAQALLVYFVFGAFPERLELPLSRHGSRGLPEGVSLSRHRHDTLKHWEGYPLAGSLGDILRQDSPGLVEQAEAAEEVISVRGQVADPPSLDYLRDTLGVLAGVLDLGGIAVLDPQMLGLFDTAGWRQRYAVHNGAPPREHVLILVNPDPEQGQWVHTRGLRKFGRPDLSLRGVPQAHIEHAGALCHKLVEMLALGAWIDDGQALDVDGIQGALFARLSDDINDPRFNNTHLEIHWPSEKHRT